jgi:hypothetical protein
MSYMETHVEELSDFSLCADECINRHFKTHGRTDEF